MFVCVYRFLGVKFKSVTFKDSVFKSCTFDDVTSVNTYFSNCTFIDTLFENTGNVQLTLLTAAAGSLQRASVFAETL